MEVLKLENVKKYYGVNTNITKAVDGISFNVDEGEFVANNGRPYMRASAVLVFIPLPMKIGLTTMSAEQ